MPTVEFDSELDRKLRAGRGKQDTEVLQKLVEKSPPDEAIKKLAREYFTEGVYREVKLNPKDEKVLTHWASIGRTFSSIEKLLSENVWPDEATEEEALSALEELRELHSPLENLHLAWRSKLGNRTTST